MHTCIYMYVCVLCAYGNKECVLLLHHHMGELEFLAQVSQETNTKVVRISKEGRRVWILVCVWSS